MSTTPPFDPADVEAVKRQIKTHMWISHDRVVDDPCIEGADEAVAGVLRVLAQRGRLVEPNNLPGGSVGCTRGRSPGPGLKSQPPDHLATPPAEPVVTEAMIRVALCTYLCSSAGDIAAMRAALSAALRVQGGGT